MKFVLDSSRMHLNFDSMIQRNVIKKREFSFAIQNSYFNAASISANLHNDCRKMFKIEFSMSNIWIFLAINVKITNIFGRLDHHQVKSTENVCYFIIFNIYSQKFSHMHCRTFITFFYNASLRLCLLHWNRNFVQQKKIPLYLMTLSWIIESKLLHLSIARVTDSNPGDTWFLAWTYLWNFVHNLYLIPTMSLLCRALSVSYSISKYISVQTPRCYTRSFSNSFFPWHCKFNLNVERHLSSN